MNKNVFFWFVFVFLAFFWAGYSLIVPFYPLEAKKFKIKTSIIGFILGFYSLGAYFSGIFLGKYMYIFDKDKLIFYCFSLHSICIIVFGLIDLAPGKNIFILVSFIFRLLQGFSIGTVYTVVMSMMRGLYGNEFQEKIAMLEMSSGLGITVGPVVGAILISFLKYIWLFVAYGILLFFLGLMYLFIVKKFKIDKKLEKNQEKEVKNNVKTIKFTELLTKNIIITYILLAFILNGFTVDYPILSVVMKQRFKITNSQVGLVFFPPGLSYMMAAPIFYFLTKLNNKLKIFIGYIFLISGLYLLLPHKNLFQEDFFWLVVIGLIFVGFGVAFITIPVIPELTILILNLRIPGVTNETVDDMASGIFVSIVGVSQFLEPFLGGILFDSFGFVNGQYYYIGIVTIIFLVYVIVGNGYEAFTKPLEVFNFEQFDDKYFEQKDEEKAKESPENENKDVQNNIFKNN